MNSQHEEQAQLMTASRDLTDVDTAWYKVNWNDARAGRCSWVVSNVPIVYPRSPGDRLISLIAACVQRLPLGLVVNIGYVPEVVETVILVKASRKPVARECYTVSTAV